MLGRVHRKQQIFVRVGPRIVIHLVDVDLQHLWIGFLSGDKVVERDAVVVDLAG